MIRRGAIGWLAVLLLAGSIAGRPALATIMTVPLQSGGAMSLTAASLTPFDASDIAAMTDASVETGFTHASGYGLDMPNLLGGVRQRFDFDVSGISAITRIDVTWTGTHEWTAGVINPYPSLRLGASAYWDFIVIDGFDSAGHSTGDIVTATRSFTGDSLARVLGDGVASVWLSTTLGSAVAAEWTFIDIGTREITAEVHRGLLEPTAVPEPTVPALLSLGLLGALGARRRRAREQRRDRRAGSRRTPD